MGSLDRLLKPFADVRAGEGATALLLALNVFLLLTAYYVLKPVRDALILGQGSAELKAYMSAGQVAVLALAVPFYGRLVARLQRRTLINVVTWFFVGCLAVFYVLGAAGISIAAAYFIWIGVFNLMVVAQFWSFANDIYTKDEGERLFPIVGFGASLGAVLGALVAARLLRPLGVYQLLIVGAVLLAVQLLVTNYVERRARHTTTTRRVVRQGVPAKDRNENPFAMVFRTRYLLLIAMTLMLLSTVDALGEYILGSIVEDRVRDAVASGEAAGATVEQLIGRFYSGYYALVNILSLFIQLFVVSRVVKHLGVATGVTIQPALSLIAYAVLAFAPVLWVVLGAKILEKSTDYSLSNTVRNMLFLPCSREEKYSAKQAIDSFFYRMGDVLTAALVFAGAAIGMTAGGFALANIGFAIIWFALAVLVGREYARRTGTEPVAGPTSVPARARAS